MGSAHSVDARYVRIFNNLTSIQSAEARIQMLDTLFSVPEYVTVAKRMGLYAALLHWKAATQRGEYAIWPSPHTVPATAFPSTEGASRMVSPPMGAGSPRLHITEEPSRTVARSRSFPEEAGQRQLARVAPPKRALDILNESYAILGIDDAKPLTHEALKQAYKRSALRNHPDKGGSLEQFDAVTKAFLYVQEVLNKLIPIHESDARFSAPVTMDSALRARGVVATAPAPRDAPKLEDRAPIALNPKKLDMAVFNKLFEENKLPDPDKDDGYGDWLKSQETARAIPPNAMRGKYNADIFNRTFEDEAKKISVTSQQLAKYTPPAEIILAPNFGSELGSDRPAQYTKAPAGSGIGYTDLKYAYGEGSTFSQGVAGITMDGRPKNLEEAKREYNSAPRALTTEEAAAVASFDRAKEHAEAQRRQRLAVHDVSAETAHERMKGRLMIQN
jgi:hypothetical protein